MRAVRSHKENVFIVTHRVRSDAFLAVPDTGKSLEQFSFLNVP